MKTALLPMVLLLAAAVRPAPAPHVSDATLDQMRFFLQWAAATYCNYEDLPGQPILCVSGEGDMCQTVTADRATVLATFAGPLTDVKGFVGLDPRAKQIVVAFRGSRSLRNYLTDAVFPLSDCNGLFVGCQAHTGFQTAWAEVSDPIATAVAAAVAGHPGYAVVATGHSLGAAIATLAAAYLRKAGYAVDLYTYGSPRVGNEAFAAFVTNQPGAEFRVTHVDDPVPRLPPLALGFRHTSPELWLATGGATTTTYSAADVRVCIGYADTDCNAGGGDLRSLDTDAHRYYFERVAGCGMDDQGFKRDAPPAWDDTVASRLVTWAVQDRQLTVAPGAK